MRQVERGSAAAASVGGRYRKRCTGLHLHKCEKRKLKRVLVFVSVVLVRQLQPSCFSYCDVFLEVDARDG